eukprot:m.129512 g.129512  ORF g.129512 m.129512 type:complete len:217 (+) comp14578_c0_seq4:2948-3598(+)
MELQLESEIEEGIKLQIQRKLELEGPPNIFLNTKQELGCDVEQEIEEQQLIEQQMQQEVDQYFVQEMEQQLESEIQEEMVHMLELEGPPGDGLNAGTAVGEDGEEYRWVGDVKGGKPNGFGAKTLTLDSLRSACYGEFKNGKECGHRVDKYPCGLGLMTFSEYDYAYGELFFRGTYNSNDPMQKATLTKVNMREKIEYKPKKFYKFMSCYETHSNY